MIEWIVSLSGIEFQKVIISYNDKGQKESEKSEEVCTKTFDLPITMPTNLVAEALSVSSISLSWNEVENALSYNVYRNNEFVTNVANPAYTYNDLEYDTEYCYTVSAVRNVC